MRYAAVLMITLCGCSSHWPINRRIDVKSTVNFSNLRVMNATKHGRCPQGYTKASETLTNGIREATYYFCIQQIEQK